MPNLKVIRIKYRWLLFPRQATFWPWKPCQIEKKKLTTFKGKPIRWWKSISTEMGSWEKKFQETGKCSFVDGEYSGAQVSSWMRITLMWIINHIGIESAGVQPPPYIFNSNMHFCWNNLLSSKVPGSHSLSINYTLAKRSPTWLIHIRNCLPMKAPLSE